MHVDIDSILIFARLFERSLIVLVVVVSCILLMILMRNKIQQIDVNLNSEVGKFATNITFYMPVFLLLVVVIFAYISFSNPVSFELDRSANGTETKNTKAPANTSDFSLKFVGFSGTEEELQQFLQSLGRLNVLVSELGELRTDGTVGTNKHRQAIEDLSLELPSLNRLRQRILGSLYSAEVRAECGQWFTEENSSKVPEGCERYIADAKLGFL